MSNYSIDDLHLLALNVGFAYHNGTWNFCNVRSPFARLYLVVEGKARIQLKGMWYDLTPGHLYFIPPFTTHSCYCDMPFSHYYIHIYEKGDAGVGILDELDFPVEADAAPYDIDLMKRLVYLNPFMKLPTPNPDVYDNQSNLMSSIELNLRRPFCDKVESRGIIFTLFSRFLKQARPKAEVADSRIQQSLVFIRKNIHCELSLEQLAATACMSKDHFIRTFRQETGETPRSYIIKRKMEEAELLLVTTDMPIKQVGILMGYSDSSYFNKVFKAYSGITPAEYRLNHNPLFGQ